MLIQFKKLRISLNIHLRHSYRKTPVVKCLLYSYSLTSKVLNGNRKYLSISSDTVYLKVTHLLCTYPVIPSFVHVCIYFEWFPLWLFLELDSLLWNIVLEVSWPFYSLITTHYVTIFNMNFLEVSLLL